jgi:hypothetical protein
VSEDVRPRMHEVWSGMSDDDHAISNVRAGDDLARLVATCEVDPHSALDFVAR